jgi:hypothetical protein
MRPRPAPPKTNFLYLSPVSASWRDREKDKARACSPSYSSGSKEDEREDGIKKEGYIDMSEMIIDNESAIRYFNQEAENLIGLLTELKEPEGSRHLLRSIKEEVFSKIDESEIRHSFKMQVDHEGNEISRYFYIAPDKWVGINILNYKEVKKLSINLYKRREVNEIISAESLIKIIFEWLKARYIKATDEPSAFMEYLTKSIKEMIRDYKISIPISNLAIDMEFEVGKVKFEFLRKELFDKIENKLKEKVESKEMPESVFTSFTSKLRKDHQGKVVGTVNVKAEVEKAVEIAEREVDRAIMVLKYLSPYAFSPKNTALFGRKGMTWLPSRELFIFSDELPVLRQEIIGNQSYYFKIDGNLLAHMKRAGLDKLSELLLKADLTEFEELLFTALYTFTKAISQISYHEKIVFILSALEIIFLKDSGEPIQISVGQRLGFFIDQDPNKRREAVSLISDAYNIRSNFIHHGQENEDHETLGKLQFACWNALNIMINNHDKFKNKQEFMLYIERLIYS